MIRNPKLYHRRNDEKSLNESTNNDTAKKINPYTTPLSISLSVLQPAYSLSLDSLLLMLHKHGGVTSPTPTPEARPA